MGSRAGRLTPARASDELLPLCANRAGCVRVRDGGARCVGAAGRALAARPRIGASRAGCTGNGGGGGSAGAGAGTGANVFEDTPAASCSSRTVEEGGGLCNALPRMGIAPGAHESVTRT